MIGAYSIVVLYPKRDMLPLSYPHETSALPRPGFNAAVSPASSCYAAAEFCESAMITSDICVACVVTKLVSWSPAHVV